MQMSISPCNQDTTLWTLILSTYLKHA